MRAELPISQNKGWRDAPILKKDGRSVHDGLHRLKAAKHLGMKTIKVQIMLEDE
jgi:ParB-like chromosome segregation protein Spo0J